MIAQAPALQVVRVYQDATAPTGEGLCYVTADGTVWQQIDCSTAGPTATGETRGRLDTQGNVITIEDPPPPREPEPEEAAEEVDDGRRVSWAPQRRRTRQPPRTQRGQGHYGWYQTGKRRD